jgi:hypothetical protein
MTRIRVVEPIVIVTDIVGTAFTLHSEHVRLACIPMTAVTYGHVFRVGLYVDGTVTLDVVTAAVFAIEHIHIVNPDVGVVSIE